jgi:hypothetical protein
MGKRPKGARSGRQRFLQAVTEAALEPVLVEFKSTSVSVSIAEACAAIGRLHPVWASLTTLAEVEAEVEAARLQSIQASRHGWKLRKLRHVWAQQQRNLWLLARIHASEAVH